MQTARPFDGSSSWPIAVLALWTLLAPAGSQAQECETRFLTEATVISGPGLAPQPDQTLVLREGRIAAIVPPRKAWMPTIASSHSV